MKLEQVTDECDRIFATWRTGDRLEAQTCRPVIDGKRVAPNTEVVIFAFWEDAIAEPVGRFRYFNVNSRNRSAEFGYTVHPQFRQQGIGTVMLTAALSHLFSTTNFNKLYCQTGAFNIASIQLLKKLNFHQDAVLREHHELDGKLWDDYIYSILRREWENR
ncbi:MAG: GNAT family N-acetyltransferase [Oculatellaceae cyanobacterium Prado106]|jgi:RimJ/RimL family protein N-acetyltransferase|nr:GNAT family N-acetyltransferase [Oculatellaceae cyanobacterium Prado106]